MVTPRMVTRRWPSFEVSEATRGPLPNVRKMKSELVRAASARPTLNLSLIRGRRRPKE